MTTSNSQQKNFIASLFDFGFTSFVTLRFLKVIYAIFVVLILLVGVLVLITSFRSGGIGVVGGLIVAPIITVFYLVLTRITFEVIAMFFRIGDNTYLAVQLLSGGRAGQWAQGGQPGYGPPAPYGSPAVPGAQWGYGTGSGDTTGSRARRVAVRRAAADLRSAAAELWSAATELRSAAAELRAAAGQYGWPVHEVLGKSAIAARPTGLGTGAAASHAVTRVSIIHELMVIRPELAAPLSDKSHG